MAGPFERIDARSAELRSELLEQEGMSAQLVLYFFGQGVELTIKIFMEFDLPTSRFTISCKRYIFKCIVGLLKAFAQYLSPVTKAHLVDQIADSTELNKQECEKIVNSLFAAMTKALQAGERVDIRGFGTFKVKDKAARQGRNPRTGETVSVPAKKVAAFKPSNEIGDLLNPAAAPAAIVE